MEDQPLLDVGRLVALRQSIGVHSYREPVAVLAPLDWSPDVVQVYDLPVWRSADVDRPALVYAP